MLSSLILSCTPPGTTDVSFSSRASSPSRKGSRFSPPSHVRVIDLDASSLPPSSPEDVHALLLADLNLTTLFLKSLPKVYWIWTHRTWCLANIPAGPPGNDDPETWRREAWERELKLVEKMLTVDARNCRSSRSYDGRSK